MAAGHLVWALLAQAVSQSLTTTAGECINLSGGFWRDDPLEAHAIFEQNGCAGFVTVDGQRLDYTVAPDRGSDSTGPSVTISNRAGAILGSCGQWQINWDQDVGSEGMWSQIQTPTSEMHCAEKAQQQDWALTLIDVPTLQCTSAAERGSLWPYTMPEPQQGTRMAGTKRLHVLSFFRTSPNPVVVGFEMYDVNGNTVVAYTEVELVDLSGSPKAVNNSRRVSTNDFVGSNCEDFFLSDGRTPVELPDTWAEAREAFRGMCEVETGDSAKCDAVKEDAFSGYPDTEVSMESDGALCTSLFEHGATFLPELLSGVAPLRRLKGGTGSYSSAGGGGAVGGRTFSSGAGSYGATSARMGTNYPRGYTSTGYGYAGRGGMTPSRGYSPATRGIVVGAVVFGGMGYGGYRWGRGRTRCYGDRCNSTASDECTVDKPCDFALSADEDFTRDDLLEHTAFDAGVHPGPYDLYIRKVDGEQFRASRICPPANWTGIDGDMGFTLPEFQDIFVAITKVDEMIFQEESTEDSPIALFVILVFLIPGVVLYCCYRQHQKTNVAVQRRQKREEGLYLLRNRAAAMGTGAMMQKDLLDLTGWVWAGSEGQKSVRYTLGMLNDGTFSGSCCGADVQSEVQGWVDWQDMNGGDNLIMWQEGPFMSEVEGRVRKFNSARGSVYEIDADFIDAPDPRQDTPKRQVVRGEIQLRGGTAGGVAPVAGQMVDMPQPMAYGSPVMGPVIMGTAVAPSEGPQGGYTPGQPVGGSGGNACM